jgi:DnaJ-class molecular chaperone
MSDADLHAIAQAFDAQIRFVHEVCHVCRGEGVYAWTSYGVEQQASCYNCAGKGTVVKERYDEERK